MGRTLLNYPNTDTSDPSNYPDGRIKDDPAGITGTPIGEVTWGDMAMFFDKLMRFAGIAPNNLPDNETNGYQFMQALNKLYSNADSGLAEAFGGSGFVPVRMSGIVITPGVSPDLNVSAGYFYYNNKLYRLTAGSYDGGISPGVAKPCLLLSTTDGLPTATIGMVNVPITPDANKVPLENLVELLDKILPFGAWQPLSGSGNWGIGAIAPEYKKDARGKVYFHGQYKTTSGSLSTSIDTIPVGYRPSVDMEFAVSAYNATSSAHYTAYIKITSAGAVVYLDVAALPSAANWYVDLSNIHYTTAQ